ncbi:hypothetical protein P9112_005119 [Eukaryota sp. TZLM1-RC]
MKKFNKLDRTCTSGEEPSQIFPLHGANQTQQKPQVIHRSFASVQSHVVSDDSDTETSSDEDLIYLTMQDHQLKSGAIQYSKQELMSLKDKCPGHNELTSQLLEMVSVHNSIIQNCTRNKRSANARANSRRRRPRSRTRPSESDLVSQPLLNNADDHGVVTQNEEVKQPSDACIEANKRCRELLNKLSGANKDKIIEEITEIFSRKSTVSKALNDDQVNVLLDEFTDSLVKAITHQPHYVNLYAKLCNEMINSHSETESGTGFNQKLKNRLEMEFENHLKACEAFKSEIVKLYEEWSKNGEDLTDGVNLLSKLCFVDLSTKMLHLSDNSPSSSESQLKSDITAQSAIIADLEEEKVAIGANVSQLEQDLIASKAIVDKQATQIVTLKSTNSELQRRIVELESQLVNSRVKGPLDLNIKGDAPSKERVLNEIKSIVNWNELKDVVKKSIEGIVDGSITILDLSGKSITDKGASAIAHALGSNGTLVSLNLMRNQIGDKGASAIAHALVSNRTLTTLILRNNCIGNKGASVLAHALESNQTLTVLNLSSNSIGGEGASSIARALAANTALTNLDFRNNNIGDKGASEIALAIKSHQSITSLSLRKNQISDEGASNIALALQSNTTLTSLDLQNNKISDQGASDIAGALQSNQTITSLDLRYNQISKVGAFSIAKLLETNHSLTALDLWNNRIGDQGASAVARALQSNQALTNLDLYGNMIGNRGACAIARALQSNQTLTNLNLMNNTRIGDEGGSSIADALQYNRTLTTLDLRKTHIGGSVKAMLEQMASSRSSLEIRF